MLGDIIAKLYMLSGSIVACTYLFQVWKVYKDKTDSRSISLIAWGAWSVSSFITLMYTITNIHDHKLIIFLAIDHLCCIAVTGFAIRNRLRNK